jgi:hypothetical protein
MKNKNTVLIFLLIVLASLTFSCSEDKTDSLTEYAGDKGVAPIIVDVSPSSGYSGVTTITITGTGFSNVLSENKVYFSSDSAKILSATSTELVVEAPIIFGDSLRLKTRKSGSEDFSNTIYYELGSAVNEHYQFLGNQEPYAATSDKAGNLYFSFIESAIGKGVYKLSADGMLSEFALRGAETTFNDLKYHSDGYLIGVFGNRAIYKIEEGAKPSVFINSGNTRIKFNALDYDKDTTIWAAGKGGFIVSVKTDKSFKLFEYADEIAGIRVYNDYLYAISGAASEQTIVRFPIVSADSLGQVENVFSFSSNIGIGVIANSITFSAAGQMYIATSQLLPGSDPMDPIYYVNTDGSFGTWYPGLITSFASSFSWGTGTELFVVRDRYPADRAVAASAGYGQSILRIDMERLGAPVFGR